MRGQVVPRTLGIHQQKPEPAFRQSVRDLEEIKIRDLRRIFGCSFRCNVGRIVGYVTGVTAENTAEKTSKARILIFSKALTMWRTCQPQCALKQGLACHPAPQLYIVRNST
jgi:hypothetical protein